MIIPIPNSAFARSGEGRGYLPRAGTGTRVGMTVARERTRTDLVAA